MKYIMIFLIRSYQALVRPLFPSACVFEPSCSEYGLQAFQKYGFFKGFYLTVKRIARCHPLQKDHYDPLL